MTRRTCAVIVAVAVCATFAKPAAAQRADLEHARALYLDADFPGSRAAFESVLGSATLDRGTSAEAHRYLAALALVLGDRVGAERHTLAAVALAPDIEPPPGAPAEAEPSFDRARRQLAGERLHLSITADRRGESLVLRLSPDVPGAIARLLLRCHDGARERQASGLAPTVSLSRRGAGNAFRCTGMALSTGGATLLRARWESPEAAPERPASATTPWPWIGAGAAVVVTAGLIAALVAVGADDGPPRLGSTVVDGW